MSLLAKTIEKINKSIGENTIVLGSEIRDDLMERFTTGSVSLDVILGGGWPVNQWHEIIGEASNGKTAIALKTIAANQKKDPKFTTLWVAAEQWVPEYAAMCGVDVSRVYVVSTNVMEEAYEAVVKVVETKDVDCIVIDSLPALVPTSEDEKEMDESTVGRGALLTNKFFRKIGKASKRSLVDAERPFIGLMINQWLKRDEWIEVGTGQEKHRIGQTIKVRTIKNKSAPPSQTAFMDFYFADGGSVSKGQYDFAKEIVAMGILNKVITRAGAYYRYGDRQWQGADAMLSSIREEVDLRETFERDVLDSIKASSKLAGV